MPAVLASRPITTASVRTPARTWRRVAPTIRSSPNSLVRWATVIESELKIVKPPTSTATPRRRAGSCAGSDQRVERFQGEAVVGGRAAHLQARPAELRRAAGDEDAVVAVLGEQRACGLEVEDGDDGLAEGLDVGEGGDAGQRASIGLARAETRSCRRPRSAATARSRGRSRPAPGPVAHAPSCSRNGVSRRPFADPGRCRSTGRCRPACRLRR